MDKLKILGIVLVFALLGVVTFIIHERYESSRYIEYNGVKISYDDYEKAKEVYKDRIGFDVCDIDTGACIRFQNIEELKNILKNNN